MADSTDISVDELGKMMLKTAGGCILFAVLIVGALIMLGNRRYNQELAKKQEVLRTAGNEVVVVDEQRVYRMEDETKYKRVKRLYLLYTCRFPDNRQFVMDHRERWYKDRPKTNERWRIKIREESFDPRFDFDKRVE